MNLKSILESILFVYGEPLSEEKLAKIIGAQVSKIRAALEEMRASYKDSGFVLIKKDDTYQLGTNPENASFVEKVVKNEFTEELSRATMETLAIIAYKGPLTRAHIEYVRGVNSSFTLRNLVMRGLVERMENPKDARSYLYGTSFNFLKHLGVARPEDLPRFEEFKKEKIEELEERQTSEPMESPPQTF